MDMNTDNSAKRHISEEEGLRAKVDSDPELQAREEELRRQQMERETAIEARNIPILEFIEAIRAKADKKQEALGEAEQRIQEIEQTLSERTDRALVRLANYFTIEKLRQELDQAQLTVENLQNEFREAMDIVLDLEEIVSEKKDLEEAEAKLVSFYQELAHTIQEEELAELKEKQRELTDLHSAMNRHNAICVHMINIEPEPTAIRRATVIAHGKATWKSQLDIILGLAPELATSTLRDGEPKDGTAYADYGVILIDGEITSAYSQDAATSVRGQVRIEESDKLKNKAPEQIENTLHTAIEDSHNSRAGSYNEVTVTKPKIGGIFVKIGSPKRTYWHYGQMRRQDEEHDALLEVFDSAQTYGLPVYARDSSGTFFELEYDKTAEEVIYKRQVTPEEMNRSDQGVDPLLVEQARENIFEDSPFKLSMSEREAFDATQKGRLYAEMLRQFSSFEDIPYHISFPIRAYIDQPKTLDPASILELLVAYVTEMKIQAEEEKKQAEEKIHYYRRLSKYPGDNYDNEAQEAQNDINRCTNNLSKRVFDPMCFAHAFAEASGVTNPDDILGIHTTYEEYKTFLERRTGKDGGFRMVEDDLKHIFAS